MGIEVPGLSLEKVDDLRNMAYGAVAALQDPPRVLAAFGQKIGDTVEEEGIAYSISYVAADVAIQILLSKGLGEVKNVSRADDLVDVARTVDTLDDTVKIADELTDVAKAVDQVGDIKDVAMAVNAVDEANAAVKAVDNVSDAAKTVEKIDNVIAGVSSTQGYSNFANGMLPEDATRYILNNEKAFFSEFSERANAAGLSNTQIVDAFEAMRNGDYAKMTTYFDTSSPVDGAVFWSGNKEGAAAYANSIGGTIMEQTPGGQVFDNWRGLGGMYPEWDTSTNLAQKPIWDALSSQYANGAEGIATYAHPDGYVGKVWSNIEKPILEENDIIIQEVIIDAK